MRMIGISYYLVYLFLAGCAASKPASSTGGSGRYTEDLSSLRPKFELPGDTIVAGKPEKYVERPFVEARLAVNDKIDPVLDSIDRIHLAKKFVDGYTIQVYSGRREDAFSQRRQLTTLMPNIESEIQFTEPIFRVKAGKYYYMMDAQADFTMIKKYFPSAIIIPEKIPLAQ
jgi:hypothetical protein